MAAHPGVAPVLSTPDTYILNELEPVAQTPQTSTLSDEAFNVRYEIERTVREIRERQWRRVALQFPDEMLPDSARVFQLLARGTRQLTRSKTAVANAVGIEADDAKSPQQVSTDGTAKLTILADTSYGSCCVDEIAAEHVNADAVVHYGRACLSPTARLPVLHVLTKKEIDFDTVISTFCETFPDLEARIVLTGDMPYDYHVTPICNALEARGYRNIHAASVIHDPSSIIPNRTVPVEVAKDHKKLHEWSLFHIGQPPTALMLTLNSRVAKIHIHSTETGGSSRSSRTTEVSTASILRRRYALVTSLATVSIWGILINTLSVKNYLKVVDYVKGRISAAGKKSYLFVVGKLNAAKVANFSEIGGWVVIGCWETSLVDSKDFYKPVITPFELEIALKNDKERLWTGEWSADFAGLLDGLLDGFPPENDIAPVEEGQPEDGSDEQDFYSDEESAPPEFDLRTGQYVLKKTPNWRLDCIDPSAKGRDHINERDSLSSCRVPRLEANLARSRK